MKRIVTRGLLALFVALLLLIIVMVIRAYQLEELKIAEVDIPASQYNNDALAEARLAKALQFKTVSHQIPAAMDKQVFADFVAWLAQTYPLVHAKLERQTFNEFTLLFTWQGKNPALQPGLFLAHYDVVPANDVGWQQPPFSGAVVDNYIWGRGAFDDKGSLIALLEATEHLLQQGHQPDRTIMLAFGHDEEVGGLGAGAIASHMLKNNIRAEFVVDEGGQLTDGVVKNVTRPVANINGAEKGYATFRLTVKTGGGHSSIPPYSTAVTKIATAIHRIHTQRLPARITLPVDEMLRGTAPALPFIQRLGIANQWLFEPILISKFSEQNTTRALLNTTVAPTILRAGTKENVLPKNAEALINFRLLPGETIASLQAKLKDIIADDDVKLTLEPFNSDPSPYSPAKGRTWDMLTSVTKHHFPDAVITPGITVGATDARLYTEVSEVQYRFQPIVLNSEDLKGFHGINERISVDNFRRMLRWYVDVLQVAGRAKN